jgi:16S rRNA processing protein RimM
MDSRKPVREGCTRPVHREELLAIGKVLKPWGLKGEVKVLSYAESADTYRRTSELIVLRQDRPLGLVLEGVREQARALLCKFKGRERIEDVESLVGTTLYLRKSELPALEQGEYYWHQLIGMEVWTDTGRHVGTLSGILTTGSNDLYAVRSGEREWLIPALREVIREVDVPANRMVIRPLEGLLDEES